MAAARLIRKHSRGCVNAHRGNPFAAARADRIGRIKGRRSSRSALWRKHGNLGRSGSSRRKRKKKKKKCWKSEIRHYRQMPPNQLHAFMCIHTSAETPAQPGKAGPQSRTNHLRILRFAQSGKTEDLRGNSRRALRLRLWKVNFFRST